MREYPSCPTSARGGIATVNVLTRWGRGNPFVVGTLGRTRGNVGHNVAMLKTKLLLTDPSSLLIYGTLLDFCEEDVINGNLQIFLETLYLLEDLEVAFRGWQCLIQGWTLP